VGGAGGAVSAAFRTTARNDHDGAPKPAAVNVRGRGASRGGAGPRARAAHAKPPGRSREQDRAVADVEAKLERIIGELLDARAPTSSICPSDAARAADPDDWRPLMEPVRQAARRLMARGEVEITQGGSVIDPSKAHGPIRIRRPRPE
jgi:hypothetical protein